MSQFPYPGLRPFMREEADVFFGREEHTDQLLEKLSQHRFIAVVGLSGCGKSSLVKAGMLAALGSGFVARAGSQWQVAEMRPGNHPLRNLTDALRQAGLRLPSSDEEQQAAPTDTERLMLWLAARGSLGLVELLRDHPLPNHTNLLIVVDQFEEMFRYHNQSNRDETEAFVSLLLMSATQQELPLYVVITMRSDFIGECAIFQGLPEVLNRSQFLAPRLTPEQLRMAIIGPARVFGGSLDPQLVNRLFADMETDPDQLPVLQHCLMRMWFQAAKRMNLNPEQTEGITLTLEDYETVGGLANALSQHAEEAFGELNPKQQGIAEKLFRCLSESGSNYRDMRRSATMQEVADVASVSPAEVQEVVEIFRHSERCFLTPAQPVPLESETVLDISHESLIRQWQRLNKWAEQETESAEIYQRLEKTASLWRQGKAGLWGTPDLDIALEWKAQEKPTDAWAQRYRSHFDVAIAFLETSAKEWEAKRQQEERQRQAELRRTRKQLTWALIGFMIALILAGWALWERSNADNARMEAEKARVIAEKRQQEAVDARKLAEEQKQLALESEKKAKQAQKDIELYSSNLKYILGKNQILVTQIFELIKSNLRPVRNDMEIVVSQSLPIGGVIEQVNAIEIVSIDRLGMYENHNGSIFLELVVIMANTGHQNMTLRDYHLTFYFGDKESTIAKAKEVGVAVGNEEIFLETGTKNRVTFRVEMGKETYQIQDTFLHILSVIASPSETPAIFIKGKFTLTVASIGGENSMEKCMIEWLFTPPIQLKISIE